MRALPSTHRSTLAALLFGVLSGCLIDDPELTGRACRQDSDCPALHRCTERAEGRRCELIYPPRRDAGPEVVYTGPVRYYCSDARPLLDTYCAPCHGPDLRSGGEFRLDYYAQDGGLPGARAMASSIKFRAYFARTMPAPDAGQFPTDDERERLAQWVDSGGRECDAGLPTDGGP